MGPRHPSDRRRTSPLPRPGRGGARLLLATLLNAMLVAAAVAAESSAPEEAVTAAESATDSGTPTESSRTDELAVAREVEASTATPETIAGDATSEARDAGSEAEVVAATPDSIADVAGSESTGTAASEASEAPAVGSVEEPDPEAFATPNALVSQLLNVREGPSTTTRILEVLNPGNQREVLGPAVDGFLPIRTARGLTGYVGARFVDIEYTVPPPPPPPDTALVCGDLRIDLPLASCPILLEPNLPAEHLELLLRRPGPALYASFVVALAPIIGDRVRAPQLALHTGLSEPPEASVNKVLTSHLSLSRVVDELIERVPPPAAPELPRYLLLVDPGTAVTLGWIIDGIAAIDLATGWSEVVADRGPSLQSLLSPGSTGQ